MGRLAVFLAALLFAVPFFPLPIAGTTTTEFQGGAPSVELDIAAPLYSANASFPVQYPGVAWRGAMNVSTVDGREPLGPSLDIGSDGVVDWEFNASYGAFGRQDLFTDGTPNFTMPVSGEAGGRRSVLLPLESEVASATLMLNGTPTAPAYASASWRNNVVLSNGALHQNLSGVTANATGMNATVRIINGTKTVAEEVQEGAPDNQPCGFSGSRVSIAQTFTVDTDGEVVEVQVYLSQIVGNPGSLSGHIRTVDANGTPTSTRISNTFFAPQSSFSAGAWNPFSFEGCAVRANTTYAVVLYASGAGATAENAYRFGANTADAYKGGRAWTYASGSATGAPVALNGTDISFRAKVRSNLTAPDFGNLTVNGTALSGPDEYGAWRADFSEPAYENGSWPIDIRNGNPFDIMSLNWTAGTWHRNHIDRVVVSLAGTECWSSAGKVFGPVAAELPAEAFSEALASLLDVYPDRFGVRTAELALDVFAAGTGVLDVVSLEISYGLTCKVPEFRYAMREYLAGKPAGTVQVPVTARALSAGRLTLSSLVAVIDQAPVLAKEPPADLHIPEDGSDMNLADLSTWFSDDIDRVPVFGLEHNSDPARVVVGFNGTYLTARAISANWTGSVSVVVNATDGRGQSARTPPFNITVVPENDAPAIVSTPPARARVGRNFTYQVEAVDAENDTLSFTLVAPPEGMAMGATGLISWVPSRDQLGAANITVEVSDGKLSSRQTFCVTVVNDNRVPAILAPSPLNSTGYAGKPYFCQFRGQDPDPGEHLAFSLDSGPAGMTVDASSGLVGWPAPVAGNFSVRLRLTDGIDFAFFSYDILVVRNGLPLFTSKPALKATVGSQYTYQLSGADPDAGAVVTLSLVSGPEGMALAPGGRLVWTPSKAQKGPNAVVVSVSDGVDTVTQSFNVTVSEPGTGGGADITPVIIGLAVLAAVCAAAGGMLLARRNRNEDG